MFAIQWILALFLSVAVVLTATAAVPDAPGGLYAVYFPTPHLVGVPIDGGVVPVLDFTLTTNQSPALGVPTDFSARYTGYIQADFTESYTFEALTDDGIRIWIDDHLVLDHWKGQAPQTEACTVDLIGGHRVPIIVEFFDDHFGARLQLSWQSAHTVKAVVPSSHLYPIKIDPRLPQPILPSPPLVGLALLVPSESPVSPVCIEVIKPATATVVGLALTGPIAFRSISDTDAYANQRLSPAFPMPVIISGGGQAYFRAIRWTPTRIDGDSSITIRKDDALLLDSRRGERLTITELNCSAASTTVPPGHITPYTFAHAGYYTIDAQRGSHHLGTLSVTVVVVGFGSHNACEITFGKVNRDQVMPSPSSVDFSANDPTLLELSHLEQQGSTAQFISRPLKRGHGRHVARIHGGTTVVALQNIDEFTLTDDLDGGFVAHQDDGDVFWESTLSFTMTPKIPYTTIHVEFYVPNATVNGQSVFDIPATDLDANGHWEQPMIGSGAVFTCHRLLVRENP